eukprot:tig00021617_g22942.t1
MAERTSLFEECSSSEELKRMLGLPVLTSEVIEYFEELRSTKRELQKWKRHVHTLERINSEFAEEHRELSRLLFEARNDLAATKGEREEVKDLCQSLYRQIETLRAENSRLRRAVKTGEAPAPRMPDPEPSVAEFRGLYSSVPAFVGTTGNSVGSSVQWELSPTRPATARAYRRARTAAYRTLGEDDGDEADAGAADTDSEAEAAPQAPAALWPGAGEPKTPPRVRPDPPSGRTPPNLRAPPLSPPEPMHLHPAPPPHLGGPSVFSQRPSAWLLSLRSHQSRLAALEREQAERGGAGASPAKARRAKQPPRLCRAPLTPTGAGEPVDEPDRGPLRVGPEQRERLAGGEMAAARIQAAARGWRTRRAVAEPRELLTTERSYVAGLRTLVEVFARPMREAARGPGPAVPGRLVEELFAGAEALWAAGRVLLAELEAEASQPPRFQALGTVLMRHVPVLRSHYTDWIRGWSAATTALTRIRSAPPGSPLAPAADLVRRLEGDERCRGQGLDSLLITPVQRVPRYILLLETLLGHTEGHHPEYADLRQALHVCRQLAATISEARGQAENAARILRIEAAVQRGPRRGGLPRLLAPHRRLVRDGAVSLVAAESKQSAAAALLSSIVGLQRPAPERRERVLYLFNDVLLCAENVEPASGGEGAERERGPALAVEFVLRLERAVYRFVLRSAPSDPLGLAAHPAITPGTGRPSDVGVPRTSSGGEGGVEGREEHVLAAGSAEERRAWVKQIRRCIRELQKAIASCERLLAVPAELRAARRVIAADVEARRLIAGELAAETERLMAADEALARLAAEAARAPPAAQQEATRRLREAQAHRGTLLGNLARLLAASSSVCERLEAARARAQRDALIAAPEAAPRDSLSPGPPRGAEAGRGAGAAGRGGRESVFPRRDSFDLSASASAAASLREAGPLHRTWSERPRASSIPSIHPAPPLRSPLNLF